MHPSRRIAPLLLAILPLPAASAEPVALDLLVSRDAVYRVPFEQLAAQGLDPQPQAALALSNAGEPVPVWVEGNADKTFGPGDSLVFVGRHLRGPNAYYDENARYNVYRLRFEGTPSPVGVELEAKAASATATARVEQRFEQDRVRVRFNPRRVEEQAEVWYWQRLSVLDKAPFEVPLELGDVARFGEGAARLSVNLRGWSFTPRPGETPDHRVELLWNGEPIGSAEWNGQASHTVSIERVPAALLKSGANRLGLRVPARRSGPKDDLVVDVALLNWIELSQPFDGHVESGQLALRLPGGGLALAEPAAAPLHVYSPNGERLRLDPGSRGARADFSGEDPALLLVAGEPERIDAIRRDHPSDLRREDRKADYLMIAHESLIESARPLAEFHRSRGLDVALIDVQDVYDEFNHGVLSPLAIRDFIAHAYHRWQVPRPRFVLLVGDASWASREGSGEDSEYTDWTFTGMEARAGRFIRNGSTSYRDLGRTRNLVPTMQVNTYEGHAASDSALVEVDGEDFHPDLAIGRLPVVEAADVDAIVRKLIAYETEAPVGPWRRSFLWIANEEAHMQNVSNALAKEAGEMGLAPVKVYPAREAADNAQYQQQLLQEFDQGNLLVHFFGHGGRYIWRTGPPDPKKNHDLFTLDHLDRLQPSTRLPVVLSMTCYSAPFDHPTADSIGEKFLRSDGRGAVGVFAASWRNSPTKAFSEAIVNGLVHQGQTVGEAIMAAKHGVKSQILVQTYNYLGDPATRLSLPAHQLVARVETSADALTLELDPVPGLERGQVIVDLFDAEGNRLASIERPLRRSLRIDGLDPAVRAATTALAVYAWDERANVDAIARLELPAVAIAETTGAL